jgi:hypothetical protein
VALAVLVGFRWHAFSLPLETDECNYAYIGGRLLEGDRLYVDVWDHQPPGAFVLFAGVIALFGQSDIAFRLLAAAFSAASLLLCYDIARRQGGVVAGCLAAAAFAICSSDPGTAGDGCNREIYMNTLALTAVAVLVGGERLGARRMLVSGSLLGIASTIKTVMAAPWLFLVIWAVARRWRGERRGVAVLETIAWMGIGPAVIWAGVFAYFALTDRWATFYDAVFAYNIGYSDFEEGFWGRYVRFFRPYIGVFASARPLWVVGAAAAPLLMVVAWRRLRGGAGAVLAYAFGSYQAVCLPGQFWPHYYYLLVPPMILIVAVLAGELYERVRWPAERWAVGIGGGVWVAALLFYQYVHYLSVAPIHVTERRYDYRMQWGRAQGERVGSVTEEGDTVFVWGHDVGIYYYSRRRCASRYTMRGPRVKGARGYEQRRRILMRELEANRPRLVLLLASQFAELREFLQVHYVYAGADMDDYDPDQPIMVVLMDRERPIELVDWDWTAPRRERVGR